MTILSPAPESRNGTDSQSQVSEAWAQHRGLISLAIRRYVQARPDLAADIQQEARIALAEALKNYRPSAKYAWSTYVVRRMSWAAVKFLSRFTRKDALTNSLDDPLRGESDGEDFSLADVAHAQAAWREESASIADEHLLKRIHDLRVAITTCATLTATEREILKAFLESGNGGTVATRLGLTPQRVSQALVSASAKLRKHLQCHAKVAV